IVPGSMRRLGGDGIVYRTIAGEAQLSAPLYLALRHSPASPIVERFRELVAEAVQASG
ncbi:LysR family transcriptional regulator, partial [Serratia marcescens subsp. marcescens ATCC 13880]